MYKIYIYDPESHDAMSFYHNGETIPYRDRTNLPCTY